MYLSMSTCATERRITETGFEFAPEEGIRQCAEAGFRYIDFNFANAATDGRPLSCPDWEKWINGICGVVKETGVTVAQTHSHWFKLQDLSYEEILWHREMVRRSIVCSAKLGDSPWVVVHPQSLYTNDQLDLKKTKEYNYRTCMEMGEIAAKHGAKIALENLSANKCGRYCSSAEELSELVSRLDSDIFGICWDFGHANRSDLDHVASLRTAAPYLRVVHCHDNKKRSDDHFIPYFGSVPWKRILPVLKEIGYKGNLNMEVHVFYNTLPQSLRMEGLRFMRSVGEEMIKIFDEA